MAIRVDITNCKWRCDDKDYILKNLNGLPCNTQQGMRISKWQDCALSTDIYMCIYGGVVPYICIYKLCMYIYIYTYIIYIYIYIYTYTCVCRHTHTYILYTYIYTYIHIYTHTLANTVYIT